MHHFWFLLGKLPFEEKKKITAHKSLSQGMLVETHPKTKKKLDASMQVMKDPQVEL